MLKGARDIYVPIPSTGRAKGCKKIESGEERRAFRKEGLFNAMGYDKI